MHADGGVSDPAEERMARLCTMVIVAACLALVWADRSPSFNASLSSPALVRSLTSDYLAVDATYGDITNPYTIDSALHLQDTAPSFGFANREPRMTIVRATDGVRYAQEAAAAVIALGATAELAPIRQELLQSYREVEHAWRMERYVEQALTPDEAALPLNLQDNTPSARSAANASVAAIRQARSLHDQAMAAVQILSGKTPSSPTLDQTGGTNPPRSFGAPYHP
jgi:hypothetical protein